MPHRLAVFGVMLATVSFRSPIDALEGWRINSKHKILMCVMHKNGMSHWHEVMMALPGVPRCGKELNDTSWARAVCNEEDGWESFRARCRYHIEPCEHALSEDDHERAMQPGSGWTKIVTIRDPIERLLSGYLDWCVDGHGQRGHCVNFEDKEEAPSFEEFAEALAQHPSDDRHFMPQSTFCGIPQLQMIDEDLIMINMSAGAVAAQARRALLRADVPLEYIDRVVPLPTLGNEHMFQGKQLKKHIITDRARVAALQLYAEDYDLFDRLHQRLSARSARGNLSRV